MNSLISVDFNSGVFNTDMDDGSSSDDNLESYDEANLGIKYQKEVIFNKLLPYSGSLEDDSQDMLREIKGNLGKCVLLKDVKSGCLAWTNKLIR